MTTTHWSTCWVTCTATRWLEDPALGVLLAIADGNTLGYARGEFEESVEGELEGCELGLLLGMVNGDALGDVLGEG